MNPKIDVLGEAERLQLDPFDSDAALAVFERRAWASVISGGLTLLTLGFAAGFAAGRLL